MSEPASGLGAKDRPYDMAIVGTVGLPAGYGGFETLAAKLVEHLGPTRRILVFCSAPAFSEQRLNYREADLAYVGWRANGWQSIVYDAVSLVHAAGRARAILVLGVSGCIVLPLIRLLHPRVRIVTNIDGLEWKRAKWGRLARIFLRFSEYVAVRSSDVVVADNRGIADHVSSAYGRTAHEIAYGGEFNGDGTGENMASDDAAVAVADPYYLMLCRIEPENNVEAILAAFADAPTYKLLAVGNWKNSAYGSELAARYGNATNIEIAPPTYDPEVVRRLRNGALAYIHGHSAGGTNPALVEAMALGAPVFAFDVNYNRHTTNGRAAYWSSPSELRGLLKSEGEQERQANGKAMLEVAQVRYRWEDIAAAYDKILLWDVR